MKVGELIQALQQLDPGLEAYGYAENDEGFQIFAVGGVGVQKAVLSRDESRRPQVAFDNEKGRPLAFVDMESDF